MSEAVWTSVSEQCKDLLRYLLHRKVCKRLSIQAALAHPWLNGKAGTAALRHWPAEAAAVSASIHPSACVSIAQRGQQQQAQHARVHMHHLPAKTTALF